MDALADDSRGIKSGCDLPGRVTRNTTAGSNQQDVAAVGVLLRQNGKNILRRQSLLGIQLRHDGPELIIEHDLNQASSRGCTPDAVRVGGSNGYQASRIKFGRRDHTIVAWPA